MSPGLRPGGTTVVADQALLLNIKDNNPLNKEIAVLGMIGSSDIGISGSEVRGNFAMVHCPACQ
jgi:hypothetical protein